MTKEALKLRNLKNKQWKKYIQTKSHQDHNKFKLSRDKLREMTRRLRNELELKLTEDVKTKPKPFWKYVTSRLKTRLDIPTLTLPNKQKAITSLQKAEALNTHFSSVFTEENTRDIPAVSKNYNGIPLSTIEFTPELVEKKLLQLDENKSPGPDSIHPVFAKRLAHVLSTPITIILKLSMTSGKNAKQWKEAIVTAIHKKGARDLAENYRPISLTSIISKLMESFIRDAMLGHMNENNLFSKEQHGFVPRRNCSTQLLEAMETWYKIIEEKGCIDIVYTDFAKAFDAVPHKRLIKKVESYGFNGKLLSWITSFLDNRKQRVNANRTMSEWTDVRSGVPQGSVLGPILFLIYINDMPKVLANTCKLFADDAKVFGDVSKPDIILQKDIDNLSSWSETWQLPFNVKKCKCLHIGRNNPENSYTMNGHILENVGSQKDLGIIVDRELKFHKQTAAAVKKANQVLGLINKTINTKNEKTIPLLYMSLVRPHLEYANVVWGPKYKLDQQKIERVQRRATKMIGNIKDLPYQDRLRFLNMPSLQHRRLRGDMIETFKIITGVLDLDKEIFFKPARNAGTRGHIYKLYKQHASTFHKQNSFSNRVVNEWNQLPNQVVEAKNVNNFKNLLDEHWLNRKFDIPFKE